MLRRVAAVLSLFFFSLPLVAQQKYEVKTDFNQRVVMRDGAAGPAGAARILADVGDIARFPDRDHFASWTGTAPLDASSGEHIRHRLSRAGNRRMIHVLYVAAISQIRQDSESRRYYRRKLAEAKTSKEALRCLKRRLSDLVYRQLRTDAITSQADPVPAREAGPGGHSGASDESSAADLNTPVIGSSDQPQPEPAAPTLPARRRPGTPHAASAHTPPRRRAGAVKVQRPTIDAILSFAHNQDVDVIVISTHGRTGLSWLVKGSRAEKVAMTTHRPVMLVKPDRSSVNAGRHAA